METNNKVEMASATIKSIINFDTSEAKVTYTCEKEPKLPVPIANEEGPLETAEYMLEKEEGDK